MFSRMQSATHSAADVQAGLADPGRLAATILERHRQSTEAIARAPRPISAAGCEAIEKVIEAEAEEAAADAHASATSQTNLAAAAAAEADSRQEDNLRETAGLRSRLEALPEYHLVRAAFYYVVWAFCSVSDFVWINRTLPNLIDLQNPHSLEAIAVSLVPAAAPVAFELVAARLFGIEQAWDGGQPAPTTWRDRVRWYWTSVPFAAVLVLGLLIPPLVAALWSVSYAMTQETGSLMPVLAQYRPEINRVRVLIAVFATLTGALAYIFATRQFRRFSTAQRLRRALRRTEAERPALVGAANEARRLHDQWRESAAASGFAARVRSLFVAERRFRLECALDEPGVSAEAQARSVIRRFQSAS